MGMSDIYLAYKRGLITKEQAQKAAGNLLQKWGLL